MNQPVTIKIPLNDLTPQNQALKSVILEGFGRILDKNAFCLGPDVEAFERDFAAYSQAAHGVAVNSGTSALHLALLALGIKVGDEVLTTPHTFVATAWAVSYCGATPAFADIDPGTFLIDPRKAERAITPKTKAILAVHLYGQPVDLDASGDSPRGPTIEHTYPVRMILARAQSWEHAVELACITTQWRLAHRLCQNKQGARVTNAPHQPSRVW